MKNQRLAEIIKAEREKRNWTQEHLSQISEVSPRTIQRLEKDGKFSPKMPSEEGVTFITRQLQKAGQMLGDLWPTAWQTAPPDTFLKSQLAQRKLKKP